MISAVSLCETSRTPPLPLLNWRCNPHLVAVEPPGYQARQRANISMPAKCALPLIPFPHKLSSCSSECRLKWDDINWDLHGAWSPGVGINGQIPFSLYRVNEHSIFGPQAGVTERLRKEGAPPMKNATFQATFKSFLCLLDTKYK